MDAQAWRSRWAEGRIAFHQTRVNARLVEHWPALDLAADAAVFVPLCGKSLDMLWLHGRGHPLLGVELSDKAVRAFFDENALPFERGATAPASALEFSAADATDGINGRTVGEAGDGFAEYVGTGDAAGIRLLAGDFFALGREDCAHVGAFYDRASLIALGRTMRPDYARHLARLMPAGSAGLLIAIDYDEARMQGPPFAVPEPELRGLFGDAFEIEELARHSGPAQGNLAERGLDVLEERVYRLLRRTDAPYGAPG